MSAFDDAVSAREEMMLLNSNTLELEPVTAGEAFDLSYELEERESQSYARPINMNLISQIRNDNIDAYIADGTITPEEVAANTKRPAKKYGVGMFPGMVEDDDLEALNELDYNGLSMVLEKKGISSSSDIELERDLRLSLKERRETDMQRMAEAEGFWPKAALFAGPMASAITDPLALFMSMVPMGAPTRAKSVGEAIKKGAAVGASVNAVTESLLQTIVWDYKQDIASPYNVGDIAMAIGTTAGLGAALGGAGHGLATYLADPQGALSRVRAARDALAEDIGVIDQSKIITWDERGELKEYESLADALGHTDEDLGPHYSPERMQELQDKRAYTEAVNQVASMDMVLSRAHFLPNDGSEAFTPDEYAALSRDVENIEPFTVDMEDGTTMSSDKYANEFEERQQALKKIEVCMYGG